MPATFSPHRQGASHIIEKRDIVLLRGTPTFDAHVGTIDTRICVRMNGSADRAMWLHHARHEDGLGVYREFHLWSYQLSTQDVESIRRWLTAVERQFTGVEPLLEAEAAADSLMFWVRDQRYTAFLPWGDARQRFSEQQVAAFVSACNGIYKLLPQPSMVTLDRSREAG